MGRPPGSKNKPRDAKPVISVPISRTSDDSHIEEQLASLRAMALKTRSYIGCDEAEYGSGWCRITVYRTIDGQRCKFVGPKVSDNPLELHAEVAALSRAFADEIITIDSHVVTIDDQPRDGRKPPKEVKNPNPVDRDLIPHRVSGIGHSYESWADAYIDLLKTSSDIATLTAWKDHNTRGFEDGGKTHLGPLARLQKFKPSIYALARKAAEETEAQILEAQDKADARAARDLLRESAPNAS